MIGVVALVPVVGNALVARGVDEGVLGTGDGHEGFEDGLVEDAFWGFGGLVGHEAINEGIRCLRYGDAGKRAIDVVRILLNALLEAMVSEVC